MKSSPLTRWVTAALLTVLAQLARSKSAENCMCELKNSERPFPIKKLDGIQTLATTCTKSISPAQLFEVDTLFLGLQRRMEQLEQDSAMLEREDDGEMYGAVVLRIIELELAEILQLMAKLNSTLHAHQQLGESTSSQLKGMLSSMQELEDFDYMQVVNRQRENQRMRRELDQCQHQINTTAMPLTMPSLGNCPQGHLVNVTGPKIYTLTQYGTSYAFGAWGKDPKPAPGKEDTHWLVALTSSNAFANFVREYSTLSTTVVGVGPVDSTIASSNPTTNTIQGPNVVMYGNALYYGCYNSPAICRFNMTTRTISNVPLPQNSGFNNKFPFGHLDGSYIHTDLDFATDESGIWVVYTMPENFGNVIISEVLEGTPPALGRTWKTSLHKRTVTNTFMVCGVLYATRFVNKDMEEIFYSFSTHNSEEKYNLSIVIKKMHTNIQSLNYNPRDRMLYMYSDAYILSYDAIFE